MSLLRLIDLLRERLPMVVRVGLAVLAALILADVVPGLVHKEHAHTVAEHVSGFWAAFGLIGCLALVVIAKTLGRLGVSTREDYYDE
ncbi:MAG TPA: hypothetical protein VLT83_14595 [Opitutaceae bacterium]|nr:hypothetical protein [Opitutaceae bacterium]